MMKEQHRASCPAMFLLLYEKEGKRRGRFLPHPIRASRRGASGRRNKALQAVEHHVPVAEGYSGTGGSCLRLAEGLSAANTTTHQFKYEDLKNRC